MPPAREASPASAGSELACALAISVALRVLGEVPRIVFMYC